MRIDKISVELRPRSSWEAAELGTALVRTHARAIWLPWAIVTLPVFATLCALGAWLDLGQWVVLALWWLKPVFDRIPLFVVSRAVFGDAPTVRETLAAQRTWGWRWMLHYLTWRRLGPYRSLYLPVDLLEGGKDKHKRRNVIGGSARGVAAWLTLVFLHFEMAFFFGVLALVPLFTPVEGWTDLMSDFGSAAMQQSGWYDIAMSSVVYIAMSVLEPFYIGAGFGLYLNRRTQLEAWDVELAFRRLRTRLGGALAIACVVFGLALSPVRDLRAEDKPPPTPTLQDTMAGRYVDTRSFGKAVDAAAGDPNLHPVEHRKMWMPRDFEKAKRKPDANPLALAIAQAIAQIFKYGAWVVAGLVVLVLLAKWRTWFPWLRAGMASAAAEDAPIDIAPTPEDDALPADVAAGARALWAQGRARRALALLYRASVASMVARTGALLVPGATEAECLRAARQLGASEDRDAFARVVRTWQYAAYADRLPAGDEFESLLSLASQRFGWAS